MSFLNHPYPYQLCSVEQCRDMDEKTIRKFGIDGFTLMELAGMQAASSIAKLHPEASHGVYLCGKGNNAGDALVVARYLTEQFQHKITLCLVNGDKDLSPDCRKSLNLIKKVAEHSDLISVHTSFTSDLLRNADYAVDGLIGTGLSGALGEPYSDAVNELNKSGLPVYSMDIPSGLNGDTGIAEGATVRAAQTFTFGAQKTGFYFENAREFTGTVILCHLPFPNHFRKNEAVYFDAGWESIYPPLKRTAKHKYQDGVVHILAGSEGLTGAAIMAAKSAWKSGAGAVILYSPAGLLDVYEKTLPEVIKKKIGSIDHMIYKREHAAEICALINEKEGVILAGPGIGLNDETTSFLKSVLSGTNHPVVLDADGLALLKGSSDSLKGKKVIITPHPGEAARYAGYTGNDGRSRMEWCKKYSADQTFFTVSKGNPVIIGTPEGECAISGYDNRSFSRAGFGDVLAGRIAGNLAVCSDCTYSVIEALLHGHKLSLLQNEYEAFEPNDLL
jgi:NAD(P)H-hydrate epimerase